MIRSRPTIYQTRAKEKREYNEAQRRFAQSDKVEEKAREAEKALDGPEKEVLRQAEAVGKRHGAGEDPAVKKQQ